MEEVILQCEDSLEGIFTAVYEAYEEKRKPEHTRVLAGEEENYRLFSEYIRVETKPEKAYKVMRTLEQRMDGEAYLCLCSAAEAEDTDKADAIYHTIVAGLLMDNPKRVMDRLAEAPIRKVFELKRSVWNETNCIKEFLRFQELEDNILFAQIGPKHNILSLAAPHFADRLPLENFMIYDDRRNLLLLHPAGKEWYIRRKVFMEQEAEEFYSFRELEYQELFRYFRHKIAIKERKNPALQQQMMPLRFQEYMPELKKKQQTR